MDKYFVGETCHQYKWILIPCRHIIHVLNSLEIDAKYIPIIYHKEYYVYGKNKDYTENFNKIGTVLDVKYPGPKLSSGKISMTSTYLSQ
eukprot:3480342-Ditylum_brightwellii.AAC.1